MIFRTSPGGIWVFPKIGIPRNGWFVMENPIKMDDLGGTTIFGNTHMLIPWWVPWFPHLYLIPYRQLSKLRHLDG